MQGRIACCNVVSDLYAMGVTDVDTMLMLLAVSNIHSPIIVRNHRRLGVSTVQVIKCTGGEQYSQSNYLCIHWQ